MGRMEHAPLLCFSHLRWDFVWQRPQQVMSRLARERRVYFIEEPFFCDQAGAAPKDAVWDLREVDGVVVCRPVCRDPGPGGGPVLDEMYALWVKELVAQRGWRMITTWFYTPMLLPAIDGLEPSLSLVVYDAMDELSLFKGAPPDLVPRERRLLQRADVVFTGGVSLWEDKAKQHGNVHAFPSGVEIEHYRQALQEQTEVPAELAALPRPRVGFFGVLDERLDLSLLDLLARRRPMWQFILVGPVRKIDATELPRRQNLHYLGKKLYRDLPRYVKGFDVCMMPFALNDATRFISPTKTLEYMAAHKPIVSTPVKDVVDLYGDVVQIASDVHAFSTAIEKALEETDKGREVRLAREKLVLAKSSWDQIVAHMAARIEEAELARANRLALEEPLTVASPVVLDAAGD